MKITWLGHATVVIETHAGRLVTDPLLRDRIVHLRRHSASVSVPENADAVLLSHLHHDHLDRPSLRKLRLPIIGPPGTKAAVRGMRLATEELRPGNSVERAGARITAVPAVHDGRRLPVRARSDDDAIGFVIEDEGQRLYFAGDTELFEGMRELGRIDLALVPIWGWGPRLGPGHMDPADAAEALARLQPEAAVPIHWGTFLPIGKERKYGHFLRDPLPAFQERAAALAPDVRIEVLEPGGSLVIRSPAP